MRLTPFLVAVLTLAGSSGLGSQAQQPVRDTVQRPPAVGTGVIRGRVVAADTGAPIRRAQVNLSPAQTPVQVSVNGPLTPAATGQGPVAIARPQSALTDAQGNFEFTQLPAGSYRLQASTGQYSGQYLPMTYGATKPVSMGSFDPGKNIDLADGQTFDRATIALPRGAVIAGHVTDDAGEPLAHVQVYTLLLVPGSTRTVRNGMQVQTDDLGAYRIFDLQPGDYEIVAEARNNTFVPANAPQETEADRTGFMTSYYPGTPDEGAAQRVRARSGTDAQGIDIRLATGRLFHLSGTVIDSQGQAAPQVHGQIAYRGPGRNTSSLGFNTDAQGRFQMRNIPPGDYRLIVRQRPQEVLLLGPRGGRNGQQPDPGEMTVVPLSITGDMDGIVITTQPPTTVLGNMTFEQGPPTMPSQGAGNPVQAMRVTAQLADPDNSFGMGASTGVVQADGTFALKGLFGEYLLRGSAPGQFLKSVTLNGEDITDLPHTFKTGDNVLVMMTSKAATVTGTVTDDSGQPVKDAALILFSDDKTFWRSNSIRTHRGGIGQTGTYSIGGLLPGRYLIVAVPREQMTALTTLDGPFFENASKLATAIVVGDQEERTVDLRLSTLGGSQ